MCIIEQKTYIQADGSPKSFERTRPCEDAIRSGTCSNIERTFARIIETKPEEIPSTSRTNEIITENRGHTRVYRDLGRRLSQKHKTGRGNVSDVRTTVESQRAAPSPVFDTRRPSPVSRIATPNSAPPAMSTFPPSLPSEPSRRVNSNGNAVYDLPPSLNMPRATVNERRAARPAEPRVSFEDDRAEQAPPRRRPSLSVHTGRRSTNASPTRASPGLSRLPSIRRHDRKDSARDIPTRETFKSTNREDNEYATRESAREAARHQKAEEEATLRRFEAMEEAENRHLDLEAERAAANRRSHDPARRMQEPFYSSSYRTSLDSERSSWSRHTSPPAPPRLPRPQPVHNTGARFASSSPRPTHTLRRTSNGTYGRATIHQYHYPDPMPTSPAANSRRPSDSIRERGRDVIERERARAAAEDFYDGARAGVYAPVFDEVDEHVSGREYHRYYVSEGLARQEIRRNRRERDEKKREFWK